MFTHRPQNTTSVRHMKTTKAKGRSVVRVNMHVSYRRALHDYPTNQYWLRTRARQAQLRCKTSRDPLAEVKAQGAVKLSSMTSQQTASNGITISFSRYLRRPDPRPIDLQALRDACPELTDIPDSFVRRNLTYMAQNMLVGAVNTRIIRGNTSELPHELPVVFNDNAAMVAPTHILALSTPTQAGKPKYTLFLIHQLPFAANCSSFPALPRSSTATAAGNRSSSATLPVVRASIPSIEAFPLFHTYLYVKDPDALRAAFLPRNWARSIDSIIERAEMIKGFWSNACAFGTLDDEMYDVVEDSWAEVLHMLERAIHLLS